MLVLSRKIGETVVLPSEEITVRVLEIRGNKVRLGFEAPRDTEIYRDEVWRRVSNPESSSETEAVCEQVWCR